MTTGLGRTERPIQEDEWKALIDHWILQENPGKRVLILPPDMTRCYSYAGVITSYLYQRLSDSREVFVMPAVGTHMQMTAAEKRTFFPEVPESAFLEHNWKDGNVTLGTIPAKTVCALTHGKYAEPIRAELDRALLSGRFDSILSIGQVVPHEVVGMANYTKNLLVGLGGRDMINKSHMASAFCGIETIMGNTDSPVRGIFDYAQRHYLDQLGITFFLTVTTESRKTASLYGLYIGTDREAFEHASLLSQAKNITYLDERVSRIVAWLDPEEFHSTWVGNKAIYRTRMALADGGTLLILAPGLCQFGENEEVDRMIRRYGYTGTKRIVTAYENHEFDNLEMAAAHLIHGSSDGRFRIIYATDPARMTQRDVESVGFDWMDIREAMARYCPEGKETGFYQDENGSYYFISAPAVGLWRTRS